jgi:RNA polymerase sigma-70 factor (ECF subfamily)
VEQPAILAPHCEPPLSSGALPAPDPAAQTAPRLGGFFAFDQPYVQRLSQGDPETERHFVDYFSTLLLIKLRSRLRAEQDVEDLRQEVFLRVLRALRLGAGLHDPSRLGAYVNTVCNNVIFEHFRHKGRVAQLDSQDTSLPSSAAGAEADLVSEENMRRVRNLLDGLPQRDRQILQAVFLDEQDKDAVCLEFGVRRDYLRVLLYRAKLRLRELLNGGKGPGAGNAPS